MLACFQFPILDLRGFLDRETGRLEVPHWPTPETDKEFVRSFGPIRRRPLGGLAGKGEARVCSAHRALRFESLHYYRHADVTLPIKCAFRRFYFDGYGMGKFEVGLKMADSPFVLDWKALKPLLRYILSLTIRIGRETPDISLASAGGPLASYYLRSTTARSHSGYTPQWWVQSGSPLLVIEHPDTGNVDLRIAPFKCVEPEQVNWGNIGCSLYQGWFNTGHSNVNSWIILPSYRLPSRTSAARSRDYQRIRLFRMYLLRFYAEQQCFLRLLESVGRSSARPLRADLLQRYLDRMAAELTEAREVMGYKYGRDIVNAVMQSWSYALPGELDDLMRSFELEGLQISESTREAIRDISIYNMGPGGHVGDTNVSNGGQILQSYGNNNINTQLRGNARQALRISHGQVDASDADDEAKSKMAELKGLLDQLITDRASTKDTIEKIQKNYEAMAREVAQKEPDKSWLEVSGKGLIDAANTCAKLVSPIKTCVTGLLSLFGVGL